MIKPGMSDKTRHEFPSSSLRCPQEPSQGRAAVPGAHPPFPGAASSWESSAESEIPSAGVIPVLSKGTRGTWKQRSSSCKPGTEQFPASCSSKRAHYGPGSSHEVFIPIASLFQGFFLNQSERSRALELPRQPRVQSGFCLASPGEENRG